jgi:putative Mg2+ transporter-C (MgtC) family protein
VITASTTFALDEEVVIRLVVASALGALIGAEREVSEQAAGLRTHIAVALGAALFGVISTLGFVEFDQLRAQSTLQADVTRVASNVVVGIGFLGAGLIFRQGSTIRNLTTAASLWTVAAIGLACGVGDVTTAALASAILLAGLVVLRPIRTFIRERWGTVSTDVTVRLRVGADPGPLIDQLGEQTDVETSQFGIRKDGDHLVLTTSVSAHQAALRRWMAAVVASRDVEAVTEE